MEPLALRMAMLETNRQIQRGVLMKRRDRMQKFLCKGLFYGEVKRDLRTYAQARCNLFMGMPDDKLMAHWAMSIMDEGD